MWWPLGRDGEQRKEEAQVEHTEVWKVVGAWWFVFEHACHRIRSSRGSGSEEGSRRRWRTVPKGALEDSAGLRGAGWDVFRAASQLQVLWLLCRNLSSLTVFRLSLVIRFLLPLSFLSLKHPPPASHWRPNSEQEDKAPFSSLPCSISTRSTESVPHKCCFGLNVRKKWQGNFAQGNEFCFRVELLWKMISGTSLGGGGE